MTYHRNLRDSSKYNSQNSHRDFLISRYFQAIQETRDTFTMHSTGYDDKYLVWTGTIKIPIRGKDIRVNKGIQPPRWKFCIVQKLPTNFLFFLNLFNKNLHSDDIFWQFVINSDSIGGAHVQFNIIIQKAGKFRFSEVVQHNWRIFNISVIQFEDVARRLSPNFNRFSHLVQRVFRSCQGTLAPPNLSVPIFQINR